jgi:hypothetical protein
MGTAVVWIQRGSDFCSASRKLIELFELLVGQMRAIGFLSVCITLAAIAVLIVCGTTRDLFDFYDRAPALFGLAILLLSINSILLLKMKMFKYAFALALVIFVLLACSFIPWYGEHVGEPIERSTHRHSIWELGHVH